MALGRGVRSGRIGLDVDVGSTITNGLNVIIDFRLKELIRVDTCQCQVVACQKDLDRKQGEGLLNKNPIPS